jgi:hypothetical protein
MSCEFEATHPEGVLYRLGRQPDPWAWPDWTYAGELGRFDNRYDDPRGGYRVLYASSERLAPFLETLARFRADPAITSVEIAGDPRDEDFQTLGWTEKGRKRGMAGRFGRHRWPIFGLFKANPAWARLVSNQRPLACEMSVGRPRKGLEMACFRAQWRS